MKNLKEILVLLFDVHQEYQIILSLIIGKSNENSVIAENIKFNSKENVVPDFFNCRKKNNGCRSLWRSYLEP